MQEFFLPKFAIENWPNRGAAAPGRLKTIKWDDTRYDAKAKYRSLRGPEFALRVESTPSAWAHAETFYEVWASEVTSSEFDPSGEAFQLWGGLLAALFWGNLQLVSYLKEDLDEMDEDLPPALEMSLPFELSTIPYSAVARMHSEGALSLLRTGPERDSAVLGVGYASCLVAPAAEWPDLEKDRRLQKFIDPATKELAVTLDHLVERYSDATGFPAAFHATLTELIGKTKSSEHPQIAQALSHLCSYVKPFCEAEQSRLDADDYRVGSGDWLGFRYREPELAEEQLWGTYPLRSEDRYERTVIFVAEGVDEKQNEWSTQQAFPGTGDETRLCDIRVVRSQDGRVTLEGLAGRSYTTSPDHRVVRLGPGPADEHTIFQSSVFVLTGPNSIRSHHLDPIHQQWAQALEPGRDATALLPLHRQFFDFFPEKLKGSLADELRYREGALKNGQGTFSWRLPVKGGRETLLVFTLPVYEWTGPETVPPSIDLWPGLRWVVKEGGAYFLRSFRRGGSEMDLAVHGERGLGSSQGMFAGDPEGSGYDAVTSLAGPPAVAELIFRGSPEAALKLDVNLPQPMPAVDKQWEVALDFGTSNTSVARKIGTEKPKPLQFRSLSARLFCSKADDEEPFLAGQFLPGWFLEGDDIFHTGFFPTLIAYKLAKFNPQGADGGALLNRLANVSELDAELLQKLIGTVDALGFYGAEALELEETDRTVWGVEDGLKWAEDSAAARRDEVTERLRKALRTAFLARLLMQTSAQALNATGALPSRYSFTYPLSMVRRDVEDYKKLAKNIVAAVESLFTGETIDADAVESRIDFINESQAVFQAYMDAKDRSVLAPTSRVVLIDVGGGSADYAVFAQGGICFLDSLRLAGNRFFEFIRDSCDDDQQFAKLADQIDLMLDSDLWTRQRSLKDDENLTPRFRRFYNLKVASMMPGKSSREDPSAKAIELQERESRVAEDVFKQKALNPTFHWKRSLFKAVLAHGLLLGLAPVKGQSKVESLNLVLAGNGWGLLCYGGIRKSADQRDDDGLLQLVEEVLGVIEGFGKHCERQEISSFREAGEFKIHFMDDLVKRAATGKGVYSKDLVAVGSLARAPIVSTEATPVASAPLGVSLPAKQGDRSFEIPWHLALSPQALKVFAEEKGLVVRSGGGFAGGLGTARMELVRQSSAIPNVEGRQVAVPEQILALSLFQRDDRFQVGLDREDLEGWSEAVRARCGAALDHLQGIQGKSESDSTSVVREVWEYCVNGRGRREAIFEGEE